MQQPPVTTRLRFGQRVAHLLRVVEQLLDTFHQFILRTLDFFGRRRRGDQAIDGSQEHGARSVEILLGAQLRRCEQQTRLAQIEGESRDITGQLCFDQ